MRIFLTGFMGAGKTTIGRLLAQKMGFPFYDLDVEIEQRAKQGIDQIFVETGEGEFRKIETDCIKNLQDNPVVVATGGGCFVHNSEWMLNNGTVIYLKVPFESLAQRIGADTQRPLWRNAKQLFKERAPAYAKAHHTIEADAAPDEVVQRILEATKFQPKA